ncbi:MAG: penicillin-insensitive murein endopeptidase [Deltaproteobacteria bacterium]|nr:penicillin-insensitive murein endopeptidase [Deltaproteobacteria bacterium]
MRAVLASLALALVAGAAGCAELGVINDGTSISVGRPNHGYLLAGAKLPDDGPGWTTREVWIARKNRYGTDELIDLIEAVGKRMHKRVSDVKLVVADLSSQSGGGAFAFHRSHQSGRDADLVYYMRDAAGQPFEPDAMHVFDARGRAKDASGITVDVPRTWLLVKDLVTAPEATVQYIFMYEPIAQMLIDHAKQAGEPDWVIAKARRALKQPGDSARHDDHLHVRVYCAPSDRPYGCEDMGPMDLLAEREAEQSQLVAALTSGISAPHITVPEVPATPSLTDLAQNQAATQAATAQAASAGSLGPTTAPSLAPVAPVSAGPASTSALGSILRARMDRISFRAWH